MVWELEILIDAGPNEAFFWKAAKAEILAFLISVFSKTSVEDISLETTPKDTSSILQLNTFTWLLSPTETALSAMSLKEQFLRVAALPLKSTPSPEMFEKLPQFVIFPVTKSPSKASEK